VDTLTLHRPDDWHLHLRDGAMLAAVLPDSAAIMGRAVVMPNLVPPVVTTAQAAAYRERIRSLLPPDSRFEPLMTVYLTDQSDPQDIEAGYVDGVLSAVKLYPAGATTNSDAGVTTLGRVGRVLERLERLGMPLLVHGEVTDPDIDIFDREAVFLDRVLAPLLARHPALRVVVEHATTSQAVDFVRAHPGRVGCTVTPQHLLLNRNDLLVGGIKPHLYCLPVLKRAAHQQALIAAVTSGEPGFFLGTDSAPHTVHRKETAVGCAGCYSAPIALQLYAQVFDQAHALDKLDAFASLNGPAFYGLPANRDTVTLERAWVVVPNRLEITGPASAVRPLMAGQTLAWRVR